MTACIPGILVAWGLAEPWWLLAVPAALLPLWLAAAGRRRHRRTGPVALWLQCGAIGLVVLALARLTVPAGGAAARGWLVLQDVSRSTDGQRRPLPLPGDLPVVQQRFGEHSPEEAAWSVRTEIADELRLAAARADSMAGTLIVTDGQFADADWPAAARALGAAGKPVWIVPLDGPPVDVRVADLAARREPDGAVRLQMTIRSNGAARGEVLLRRIRPEPAELLRQPIRFLAADAESLRMSDRPPPAEAAAYEVAFVPAGRDGFKGNNAARVLVVPSRTRVGLVSAGGLRAGPLAEFLGVPVADIPAAAMADPSGLMGYAAVVLSCPTGEESTPAARTAVAEYVRSGGGLLQVGTGPHSSPADEDDPLNRVAALRPNPFQRRPLKVVVVLDASGSMAELGSAEGGRVKFELASEAVLGLKRHLTGRDQLAVVTFSDSASTAYDSDDGRPDFGQLRQGLADVRPAGPTNVVPALRLAAKLTGQADSLVIVVSDLATERFQPEDRQWLQQAFAPDGKRHLAVVVTGSRAEPRAPLDWLAGQVRAPMRRQEDLTALAEAFARFLRRTRGEAVRGGDFTLEAMAGAFGMEEAGLPLKAYILSAASANAEVLGRVRSDPVLARRRAGLGKVVSLAVPLPRAGADPNSGAVLELLAGATRWAMRSAGDGRFSGELHRRGAALRVVVQAAEDGEPMNGLRLRARVRTAAATGVQAVRLEQVGPGRYEADLPAGGAVSVSVSQAGREVWQGRLAEAGPPELQGIGADWDNLRRLAAATGGRIVRPRELAELGPELVERGQTALWPYLLAAALALMLLEWAFTRILRRGH